ncbi:head maturation protease, ClpP-related [Parapedobacter lycopersici]|uniref:head maturation protease, ClpP-related n=1 Tax=Parapedobacter lycopersici TaxID=1864939 RepID=UPI00333F8564
MKRPFFSVVNAKAGEDAKIVIYGVIGSWWEGNEASEFVKKFNELEKSHERINVHINSPGGSVWDMLPIFNAIKSSKKDVHTYVDGIAFSAGGMILLAAKKGNVHMAKGSLMMLHSVSTGKYGNARAFRKEAETLDTYDDVLGQLIADRTGKTLADAKSSYLDYEDHYYTPQKAKEEGLIDHIEDYEAEEMPENVRNMKPEEVAAWYQARTDEPSPQFMDKVMAKIKAITGLDKDSKPENMFGNKFSKLTALAKVAAGSVTAEQVDAVNTEIAEAGIEGVSLVLDSELQEAEEKATKNDALVTQAKKDADRIKELEQEVEALKKTPAAETTSPVTKKDDVISTGEGENVEDFTTSWDREAQAFFAG